MATSLRHNLTSAYLDAAHKFSSKKGRRRIVAYVESYDDIAFWRTLLAEFENEERYFQVMLPSATSLAKGKKMVLMNTLNTTELGRSLIACVDSDYDFLLQAATDSRSIPAWNILCSDISPYPWDPATASVPCCGKYYAAPH